MNELEYKMADVLKVLKNKYGVFEIKAEFEAEGSRMEEMMRLKDLTAYVGLPIILKIGGVEAVTDVYNALSLGVKGIIAPMAETPFALSKFLNLIKTMVAEDNARDLEFAFNLETITGFRNMEGMYKLPDLSILSGMTIGRVDLTGSMGLGRDAINTSEKVYDICEKILIRTKKAGLKTGLGGGITKEVLPIVARLAKLKVLDKFETRKVVFPVSAYKHGYPAILKALEFELLWLKSKRRYYSRVKVEDENRIAMLEKRVDAR
ncbi:MAG: aldolase/citrate lyase family protein [Elusimicrobia bacterium]|nr:aldolase/citrate lyase family protein [Elusimicrobiota bacterium]